MARAIDVDRVKREIRKNKEKIVISCKQKYVPLSLIYEILNKAPTLTPPNEWVRVEDVMPPEHEPVLCLVDGKPKPNIMLEDAYQLGSWNKADGWIIDEWLDWEGANVTWWMKLPEPPDCRPPEGEEEENDVIEITENL